MKGGIHCLVNGQVLIQLCVVFFFPAVCKYLRRTAQRRKDLFWLVVSEVLVHGYSPGSPVSGPAARQKRDRRAWQKRAAHFIAGRKQGGERAERKGWGATAPSLCPMTLPLTEALPPAPAPSWCHQVKILQQMDSLGSLSPQSRSSSLPESPSGA